MRIFMMLTDAYGCLGGIAKFNRDLLAVLAAAREVTRVVASPRRLCGPIDEPLPEALVYRRAAAGGKWRFALDALHATFSPGAIDLVICGHLHLLPLAWLVARLRRAQLALILFGVEAWRRPASPLLRALARRVDHVVSVSRVTQERFRAWCGGDEDRFRVISPSLDLDVFTPGDPSPALRARYGLAHPTLMTIARLAADERYKGIDELLELLPRLACEFPGLRYLVVGDGDDRARLQRKAQALGVGDRVIFTGAIAQEDKIAHLRLADVFAMPSVGEGFGIVLIEAAACGARVIGGDGDGAREALLGGELGALVDPTRPEALYEVLAAALRAPRLERIGDMSTFSKQAFAARIADWLAVLAQTPQARAPR